MPPLVPSPLWGGLGWGVAPQSVDIRGGPLPKPIVSNPHARLQAAGNFNREGKKNTKKTLRDIFVSFVPSWLNVFLSARRIEGTAHE